jgi:hypothetical protein
MTMVCIGGLCCRRKSVGGASDYCCRRDANCENDTQQLQFRSEFAAGAWTIVLSSGANEHAERINLVGSLSRRLACGIRLPDNRFPPMAPPRRRLFNLAQVGHIFFLASGAFRIDTSNSFPGGMADAEFAGFSNPFSFSGALDLGVTTFGSKPNWGPYSPSHEYLSKVTISGDNILLTTSYNDTNYGDNSGSLTLQYGDLTKHGDFNGDGQTDGDDFLGWQRSLGTTAPAKDANLDGQVGAEDLASWMESFGDLLGPVGGGGSFPIPEPQTLTLTLVGLVYGSRALRQHKRSGLPMTGCRARDIQ